jgi:cell division protein FtsW (lipid II flippase)
MEIAGKTLRRRVGTALVVFLVLMIYDYATDAPIRWAINLVVPVLYFAVSIGVDTVVQRRFGGTE